MTIPNLHPASGYLPPGEHEATLMEVREVFATNYGRRMIFANLHEAVKAIYGLGAHTIWIDGSYVTDKQRPHDVEVVYDVSSKVDTSTWGDYAPSNYLRLKQNRQIDLWPYPSPQPTRSGGPITILEFFGKDRDGVPKGVIRLTGEGL